jgi:hypothetical protein
MNIRVRIMLADKRGDGFMGVGLLRLLENIDEAHSIAKAAREMGLSLCQGAAHSRTPRTPTGPASGSKTQKAATRAAARN